MATMKNSFLWSVSSRNWPLGLNFLRLSSVYVEGWGQDSVPRCFWGLAGFSKNGMHGMGWDGMGWDIGYDVATATLFNGSPPSLLSPKASRSVAVQGYWKKNLPHSHPSCCSQTHFTQTTTNSVKKQMKIFEPGQCNSLQAITYHSWCSYDIEIYMVQLWLIPARNFSSSHCVWEPRFVG